MTTPYLILHKVRGEPAFDIAEQHEVDGEVWWIVSTSGHRAYPIAFWQLSVLSTCYPCADGSYDYMPLMTEVGPTELRPEWDDLPDHYEPRPAPKAKTLASTGLNLLSQLGLLPKIKRRV